MITVNEKPLYSLHRRTLHAPRHLAWQAAAFAALLLLGAGVLLAPGAADAQQNLTTFLSNVGTAEGDASNIGLPRGDNVPLFAQAFRTGDHAGGYTLAEVHLRLGSFIESGAWTVSIRTDAGGEPSDTDLYTLDDPGSHTAREVSTFATSSNRTLSANTTYYVVVQAPGNSRLAARDLADDELDGTPESGWGFPRTYQYLEVQQAFADREEGEATPESVLPSEYRYWQGGGSTGEVLMISIMGANGIATASSANIEVRGIDGSVIASGTTSVSETAGTNFGVVPLVADDGSDGFAERTFTIANTAPGATGAELRLPVGVLLVGVGTYRERPVERPCRQMEDETQEAFDARCPLTFGEYVERPTTPDVNSPFRIRTTGRPSNTVAAAGTTTFTVRFNPQRRGGTSAYSIEVLIPSNDPDTGAYRFRLTGRVRFTEAAMRLADSSGRELRPSGNRYIDFGTGGATRSEVITVRNVGDHNLFLGAVSIEEYVPEDPVEDPTDYSIFVDDYTVTDQPAAGAARTVAPNASTTFTIRYVPDDYRLARATLRIGVFNDSNLRPTTTPEASWADANMPEFEMEGALRLELRGRGAVPANEPATGMPTIMGTAQVDQVLTAGPGTGMARIKDDNNVPLGSTTPEMDKVVPEARFSYQWQRADDDAGTNLVDILGATGETYIQVEADIRKRLRVRLSFTDDAGYPESLTSDYTTWVAGPLNSPAHGAPLITGTPRVGQVLTASRGSVHDPNGRLPSEDEYSFQWLRGTSATDASPTPVGTAGSETYEVVSADQGMYISVRVSFVDRAGHPEARTSSARLVNTEATGGPTIAGTPRVGQILTATATGGIITDANGGVPTAVGDFRFRWFIVDEDGSNPIPVIGELSDLGSATNANYYVGDRAVGKRVRVEAEFIDDARFREVVTSADYPDTGTVEASASLLGPGVRTLGIVGDGRINQMLRVSGVDTGWSTLMEYDAFATAAAGTNLLIWTNCVQADCSDVTPANTAARQRGNSGDLTLSPGADSQIGSYIQVQAIQRRPYVSGEVSGGMFTTGDTFSVILGKAIFGPICAETATTCDARQVFPRPFNYAATGTPTLSGTPAEGMTLTTGFENIRDGNGGVPTTAAGFTYQWQRLNADDTEMMTGQEVVGGIAHNFPTFTLGRADVDMRIRVTLTFTDADGHTERVASDPYPATGTIGAANVPATGSPTISGANSGTINAGAVDEVLTAAGGDIADMDGLPTDPAAFSYQWFRGDAGVIPGETGTTYTLAADDVGRNVRVRVSFTDGRGFSETRFSGLYPHSGFVKAANVAAAGTPTITGGSTARVGRALTADTTPITDSNGLSGVFYNYQWERADDAAGTTNLQVVGGGATYTPVKTGDAATTDMGKFLRVTVSFNDDDGYPEQRSSDYTPAVLVRADTAATGNVSLSGTSTVGRELSAQFRSLHDPNGLPELDTFSYQWQRGSSASDATPANIGNPIVGAEGRRYTLVKADEGRFVRVQVSFTDGDNYSEELHSPYTSAVAQRPQSAATGTVRILGFHRVDQRITVDTSDIRDANGLGTFSYQWQRGVVSSGTYPNQEFTYTDLTPATSQSYLLTDDDLDMFIRVQVSFTDGDGNDEMLTSRGGRVSKAFDVNPTGRPTITGDPKADATLTADTSGIMDDNGLTRARSGDAADSAYAFTYQWQRVATDGTTTDVGTASQETYTPQDPADVGSRIRVLVSYMDDDDYEVTMLASEPTVQITAAANNVATGTPTITGTEQVGETLMVSTSGITDGDGPASIPASSFTYQWQREELTGAIPVNIDGAVEETYVLQEVDQGRRVRVRVSFTDGASNTEERTSALTAVVIPEADVPATGVLRLTGRPRVSETLTVSTLDIADENGFGSHFEYQWRRVDADGMSNPDDISGATSQSYTLQAADAGRHVQVTVRFEDGDGNNEMLTSAPIGPVIASGTSFPAVGAPTIFGLREAKVGVRLQADTSVIADLDGMTRARSGDSADSAFAFTYQWQREESIGAVPMDIDAEDASFYTLTGDDLGKRVRVRVRFQDDGDNDEELFSLLTTVVAAGENSHATGAPTFDDATPTFGETLTLDTTPITDANGLEAPDYSYTWWRYDPTDARNTLRQIASASGNSYVLRAGDIGMVIYVQVSFTDDDGNEEILTSALSVEVADGTGAPTPAAATGAVTITGIPPQVGMQLTAVTSAIRDTNGPSGVIPAARFSYQWRRADDASGTNDENILGATSATYTPVLADAGSHLQVVVSFQDDDAFPETVASAWTTAAVPIPDPTSLVISGEGRLGTTLTVSGVSSRWHNAPTPVTDSPPGTNLLSWSRCEMSDCSDLTLGNAQMRSIPATGMLTYTIAAPVVVGEYIQVSAVHLPQGVASLASPTLRASAIFGPICAAGTGACGAEPLHPITVTSAGFGTAPAGGYMTRETITVNLTFEAAVAVDTAGGVPHVVLQIGNQDRNAVYNAARSSGRTVAFTYTVVATDMDADGILLRADSLNLNGGTIASASGRRTVETDFAELTSATHTVNVPVPDPTSLTIMGEGKLGATLTVTGVDERWHNAPTPVTSSPPGTNLLSWTRCTMSDCSDLAALPVNQLIARSIPATGRLTYTIAAPVMVGEYIQVSALHLPQGVASLFTPTVRAAAIFGPVCDTGVGTCDAAQVMPNSPATNDVTITGTPQVGVTLMADTSAIRDADGPSGVIPVERFSYQWRSADDADGGGAADIAANADGASYTPIAADEGKHLQVVVTFMDDANNEESKTSAWTATAVISATAIPDPTSIIISGEGKLGTTLTVTGVDARWHNAPDPVTISPPGTNLLSWTRCTMSDCSDLAALPVSQLIARSIPATGMLTYTIAAPVMVGEYIQVSALHLPQGVASLFTPTVRASAIFGPICAAGPGACNAAQVIPNNPATNDVTITGTPQVGVQLMADTSAIRDADGPSGVIPVERFSYQWRSADDADGAGAADIAANADGASYTPIAADEGKHLQVVVTFMDDASNEETKTSAWTATAVISATAIPDPTSITISGEGKLGTTLTVTGVDARWPDVTIMNIFPAPQGGHLISWLRCTQSDCSDIVTPADGQRQSINTNIGLLTYEIAAPVVAGEYILVTASEIGTGLTDLTELARAIFGPICAAGPGACDAAQVVVNNPATNDVTITGTPQVGVQLMADTSAIRDADGPSGVIPAARFSYQWRSADDAAGGGAADIAANADGASYTPIAADEGKHLQVVVTFMDDASNEETKSSAWTATAVLSATAIPDPTSITISGEGKLGTTLTVTGVDARWPDVVGIGAFLGAPAGAHIVTWLRCTQSDCSDIVTPADGQRQSINDLIGMLTYAMPASNTPDNVMVGEYVQVTASEKTGTGIADLTALASAIFGPICAAGPGACDAAQVTAPDPGPDPGPDPMPEPIPASEAPVLDDDTIVDREVTVGEMISFTATATDSDNEQDELVFTLGAGAPEGAEITTGGAFTWTPTASQFGEHRITVRVSDTGDGDEEVDDTASFIVQVRPDAETVEKVVEGAAPSLAALGRSLAAGTVNVIGARFAAPKPNRSAVFGGQAISGATGGAELLRGAAAAFGVHLPPSGAAQHHAADTGPALATGAHRSATPGFSAAPADTLPPASGGVYGRGAETAASGMAVPAFNSPSLRQLLSRSAFEFTLGGGEGADPGVFAFWGRGEAGGFENNSEQGLRYDGDISSGHAGFDYRRGNMLVGLALSFSESEVDYTSSGLSGTLDSELTVFTPYASWTLADGLDVYGAIGYGTGDAEIRPDASNATAFATPDLEMLMGALGFARGLSGVGSLDVSLKGDALLVRFRADAADGFPKMDAESERFRLGMEGTGPLFAGNAGDTVNGTLELGARYDSGDAEQGAGIELGGGLTYSAPRLGLTIGGRGRLLVLHSEDDFEEWGASLEARMDPGVAGRGLGASLRPAWGDVESGVDAMFEEEYEHSRRDDGRRLSRNSAMPDRMDLEVGYGMGMLGGRALLSPFGKLGFAPGDAHRLRLGARFAYEGPGSRTVGAFGALDFELFGERRRLSSGAMDGRIGLDLRLDF